MNPKEILNKSNQDKKILIGKTIVNEKPVTLTARNTSSHLSNYEPTLDLIGEVEVNGKIVKRHIKIRYEGEKYVNKVHKK